MGGTATKRSTTINTRIAIQRLSISRLILHYPDNRGGYEVYQGYYGVKQAEID